MKFLKKKRGYWDFGAIHVGLVIGIIAFFLTFLIGLGVYAWLNELWYSFNTIYGNYSELAMPKEVDNYYTNLIWSNAAISASILGLIIALVIITIFVIIFFWTNLEWKVKIVEVEAI